MPRLADDETGTAVDERGPGEPGERPSLLERTLGDRFGAFDRRTRTPEMSASLWMVQSDRETPPSTSTSAIGTVAVIASSASTT